MKIANGVEMLELTRTFMGSQGVTHPTLIWEDDTVILVDTGDPGHLEQIRTVLDQAGVPLNKLNKVILTHQDIDHIGNLPDILDESQHKIEVMAHEMDKPYIDGTQLPMKMNLDFMKSKLPSLPEEQRKVAERVVASPPKTNVDVTLADGEVLPYFGGITVIHTPGHTPGHISLYLKERKILIAGDAMVLVNGELRTPPEQFTPDMAAAVQSIKKLTNYDIETIICYHGGVFNNNANQALAEFAKGL